MLVLIMHIMTQFRRYWGLLGDGAPISASTVARLKEKWQGELAAWGHRRLNELEGVSRVTQNSPPVVIENSPPVLTSGPRSA